MPFSNFAARKSIAVCLICCFLLPLFSCNNFKKNNSHRNVPNSHIAKGKDLAEIHCQSCHMLPDPALLDAKNWETGVLPAMGPRLGIFDFGFNHYPFTQNDSNIGKDFYPSHPLLSEEQWQYILDYYTSVSPDSLPVQQRKYPIDKTASLFKVEMPAFKNAIPSTCLVQIDTASTAHMLFISDMLGKKIIRFDNHLQLLDSFSSTGPIVDMELRKNQIIACNIGVLNPNNGKYGSGQRIIRDEKGKMQSDSSFALVRLARPVQLTSADFNGDGMEDYLVCEFGNLTGALSWMENKGNKKFERHVLRAVPGAIKAYVRDVNHDGLPDIWVLFAQGEEGIFLFTNKGKGKFEQEEVLRFQPIYGSTYFELDDFNQDGHPDILYTCGDNADFSPVLKPYHGVYIFMNDGTNHFKQQFFFPINGCFKAMARDFDNDGDLDIAAISFFADYARQPEEGFVYLENKGNMNFYPYSVAGTTAGRWLTMDAADLDGDGKIDIVLGNFSVAPSFIQSPVNWKEGPPFMVLKNIIKKPL